MEPAPDVNVWEFCSIKLESGPWPYFLSHSLFAFKRRPSTGILPNIVIMWGRAVWTLLNRALTQHKNRFQIPTFSASSLVSNTCTSAVWNARSNLSKVPNHASVHWASVISNTRQAVYALNPFDYLHTDSSGGGKVISGVCLSVCFSTRYLKNDAARITKLGIETFHRKSWKLADFEVKSSEASVTRYTQDCRRVFVLLWVPTSSGLMYW